MAFLGIPIVHAIFSLFGAYLVYGLFRAIYNVYFHPLSKVPGPISRAASFFPQHYELWTGDLVHNWHALHEKYGDVVRMSPDWVSVIKPDAWRDIYGSATKKPIPKDNEIYHQRDGTASIIASNDADHTRIRRLLNHAFSDTALRSQESIINSYITLFIAKLRVKATSNTPVDIMRYLNFTTFDILGDLCFDESFHSLESEEYGSWISGVFNALKMIRLVRLIRSYPLVGVPFLALVKKFPGIVKAEKAHRDVTVRKMDKRMNTETDRKDFMSYILKHNDEKGMTRPEMIITMGVMIIAGSETSATLLSGAVYYLTKNPAWLRKLHEELRENFRSEEEMTFASLSQLKVMHAIIMETFRMYPPTPTMLPRRTYGHGVMVADTYIPQDVTVGVPQYSAYRSSRNFKDADTYAPQRFLHDERYADDKRSVMQPFSVGPRNCIGQNMAWAEIRSILARLVWNFDMELQPESAHWGEKQKVYILWDKPSLMVKLTPREQC